MDNKKYFSSFDKWRFFIKERPLMISNSITVTNCFGCAILHYISKNEYFVNEFASRPIFTSGKIFALGIIYTIFGLIVSNINSYRSNINFNVVVFGINCWILKNILSKPLSIL